MKSFILVTFFILPTISSAAQLTLKSSVVNRELEATSKETGDDGKLSSTGNIHYGIALEIPLSKSFRTNFGVEQKKFQFDNTDTPEPIEGEETIDAVDSFIGIKWIVFSRTALRLDFHYEEDIAFTQNVLGKAELFKEGITYLSVNLDQILYLSAKMYAGFKLGSEILISSNEIESRAETHYGLFLNYNTFMGAFEFYGEMKNVIKDTKDLEFVQSDLSLHLDLTVRF